MRGFFVCFQREKVSLYIHIHVFKRISFNERGKKRRGLWKSKGRGGQAQSGAIQSDPKAPVRDSSGGRAPVMPGAPRDPGTLLMRARRSLGCQPRSRGACRVRGHKGRRCEVPAASPGCRGEPRPLRSATKTEPGSEQRAGEHRGEGQGGSEWRAPTRKVRELLCVRGLFINQPDTEQTWPLFAECLLFHQLLRPCSSFC